VRYAKRKGGKKPGSLTWRAGTQYLKSRQVMNEGGSQNPFQFPNLKGGVNPPIRKTMGKELGKERECGAGAETEKGFFSNF